MHAEDQRETEREQRIDAANDQAVENLLRDHPGSDLGRDVAAATETAAEAIVEILGRETPLALQPQAGRCAPTVHPLGNSRNPPPKGV